MNFRKIPSKDDKRDKLKDTFRDDSKFLKLIIKDNLLTKGLQESSSSASATAEEM